MGLFDKIVFKVNLISVVKMIQWIKKWRRGRIVNNKED